jgi:hypothetical protein
MNIIKGFAITTAVMVSSLTFAANSGAAIAERENLVAALYSVVTVFAMLLGIGLIALGAVKLKRRAENPNDARSFPAAILITFLAGALIVNYSGTSSTLIATLLGSDSGHCFVLQDKLDANGNYDLHQERCWDSSNSDYLNDVSARIEDMTEGGASALKQNVEIIVALFQLIGLVYLIKGIYGLKLTAEGNGRDGYMKPLVTMIASALVIDLPHTLEILNNTVKLLGFGGGS